LAWSVAGEELADGIEGAEENGGRGARGAGDGGLIDELDAGEVLAALEVLDGRGVAFGLLAELAGEVQIDDIVGEGGFAGAGDAGEADEEAERESASSFFRLWRVAPRMERSFLVGLRRVSGTGMERGR
jgi:hypothetical protein